MDRMLRRHFQVQARDPNMTEEEVERRIAAYYREQGVHCLRCLGSGTVTEERHREEYGRDGSPVMRRYAVTCPDCGGRRETEEQAYQRRVAASGIPEAMRHFTFDRFRLEDAPAMAPAYRAAFAFADRPHGGLVLLGNTGTGKTHLSVAAALRMVRAGLSVRWGESRHILADLRRSIGEGRYHEAYAAWAEHPTVLVVDDYAAEVQSEWGEDVVEGMLMYRYSRERAWILTANVGQGDLSRRLQSRFQDRSRVLVIQCDSPDYRPRLRREVA